MTPNFDNLFESILQEAKAKKRSKKRKSSRNKSVKVWPWGYWGGYDSSLHDVGGGLDGGGGGE